MISESIVIAIITGVLAVLGSYMGNVAITRKKARADAIRDAKNEQRLADKLDRLEKKVDEHNGWGEKFGEIKKDIAVIKTEIEILRKEHFK